MSGMLQQLAGNIYHFWTHGWEAASSKPKAKEFISIPQVIIRKIGEEYLTPKEWHNIKRVCIATSLKCQCYPLCKLVSNQFSKVIYRYYKPQNYARSNENARFTEFFYVKSTKQLITGDFSDYTTSSAITIFKLDGSLQLSAKLCGFDKSVVALKQIDNLIICFSTRESGVWDATTGEALKLFKNPFELSKVIFSQNNQSAFLVGYGGAPGYIDFTAPAPLNTFHHFKESTHAGRIEWVEEDPITGYVFSGCDGGIVNIWDQHYRFVRSIKTASTSGQYCYVSSKSLLFASLTPSSIGIWNTVTGNLERTLTASHPLAISDVGIKSLKWNEKDQSLYACWAFMREDQLAGTALIWWNLESGYLRSFLLKEPSSGLYYEVMQIALSSHNDLIFTGGYGVQLWNKQGMLLWKNEDMKFLHRFEWDQEANKIFMLTPCFQHLDHTLAMIDYEKI
jgi:WD40 repeat protein